MAKQHIMLDLETLGTEPFAALLSIGAVHFNPNADEIADSYHVAINPEFNGFGLRIEPGTMFWWWGEDRDDARHEWLRMTKFELAIALDGFTDWMSTFAPEQDDRVIWGNGANFDNVLLACAYKAAGRVVPWNYWNDRCFRTLKALPKAREVCPPREGLVHNAMFDARHQAAWLQQIVKAYELVI